MGTLAAIAYDVEIRNILSVTVGVVVLCGSVYLLLASNIGIRTGMLVALTGLFGWMATMGAIWWIYGIGLQGSPAVWHPVELNYSADDFSGLEETALSQAHALAALDELPSAEEILEEHPEYAEEILPPELFAEGADPEEREARIANISLGQLMEVHPELEAQYDAALDGWHLLPVSDRQRGDASASADAFLGPDGRALFDSSSGYQLLDVYSFGGKEGLPDDPNRWDRIWTELRNTVNFRHPAHYAVVQVRPVVPVETVAGEAPPPPVQDEDAPILSVVLERDLGDKRFPAAMTTVISSALFALFGWMLHRRDAKVAEARAA